MADIALITGASSGMGAEFARQLDKRYAKLDEIWLLARNPDKLSLTASHLRHKTRILQIDLSDRGSRSILRKALSKEKPIIRFLVNAAGYGVIGSASEISIEEQTGMVATNCEGLTEVTLACLPYMSAGSEIIELASAAAFMAQPEFAVYAASKAYALSFSRALRQELRQDRISVTAVCPGPVNTGFFDVAEKYHKTASFKKLSMARADQVVAKALKDAKAGRAVSVYGLPMNLSRFFAKILPHSLIEPFFVRRK